MQRRRTKTKVMPRRYRMLNAAAAEFRPTGQSTFRCRARRRWGWVALSAASVAPLIAPLSLVWLVLMNLSLASVAHAQPSNDHAEWPVVQVGPDDLTQNEVAATISVLQDYLWGLQDPTTGAFASRRESGRNLGGPSSLAILALIESGVPAQDSRLQRGLAYIASIEMEGVYARSLRLQVWSSLPADYLPQVREDLAWLVSADHEGLFGYTRDATRGDHSNTHFGVLGLAACERRGIVVPAALWQRIRTHFLACQNADGGWGYRPGSRSDANMTAAGLTAMLAARSALDATRASAEPETADSVRRALGWIQSHDDDPASRERNVYGSGHGLYGLLALERALLWDGRQQIAGRDWYRRESGWIVEQVQQRGDVRGNIEDSAFALLFLSRGHTPIWANKLRIPDTEWNRRPDDLHHLTRRLSDWREVTLGWQVVDVDSDPVGWLDAPLLYLSIDAPLDLDDLRIGRIRRYLDLGGLLIVNLESDDEALEASIRQTVQRLDPGLSLTAIDDQHPAASLVLLPEDASPVLTAHNGARDLVLVLPEDVGLAMQRARIRNRPSAGADSDAVMRRWINLYALSTDRGRDRHRLESLLMPSGWSEAERNGRSIRVGRVVAAGQRVVEPLAWAPMVSRLEHDSRIDVRIETIALQSLYDAEIDLAHFAGTEAIELTRGEIESLQRFVQNGGRVLLETLGGHGEFARSVSRQLEPMFGPSGPIPARHDLLRLTDSRGMPIDVAFTRYTTERFPFDRGSARLRVHQFLGRDAIFVSEMDLSLGAMSLRRFGIHGYAPPTARAILTNLLLSVGDTSVVTVPDH